MQATLELTWFGHSCFRVEVPGCAVVLDPYEDGSVPGLPNVRTTADLVLCSHDHFDHNNVQAVTIKPAKAAVPMKVTRVPVFHDEAGGKKRGQNIIHVLEGGGFRLAHLGDLGHLLSERQAQEIGPLDVCLIPVGGFYTIDAAAARQVIDLLKPRIAVPMHYRGPGFGFPEIGTVEEFLKLCDQVRRYPDNHLRVTQDTPRQVAVLQAPGQDGGEPCGL